MIVFALQSCEGDTLIFRASGEAINAGQVNQLNRVAAGRGEMTAPGLNRRAGIIGDLGPAACEAVKERGLAGIGSADQGEARGSSLLRPDPYRGGFIAAQRNEGGVQTKA